MLRGYRGVLAAIAGLILCCGASPQPDSKHSGEQQYRQGEPAKGVSAATNQLATASISTESPPVIEKSVLTDPCEKGQDRRESDLCAQWKAADAAARAALWAMIGTFVAALGTIGLFWQIHLTRKAVEDTGEATKAMREANEIARKAQRPWVSIAVKPTVLESRGAAFQFEAEVSLTNKGSMVAKNINIGWELVWAAFMPFTEIQVRLAKFADRRTVGRKILIPGDTEVFRYWKGTAKSELPFDKPGEWKEGHIGAVFLISVHYQSDGTGDEWHHTDQAYLVCYRSNGEIHSGISKSLRSIKADNLFLEPITAGALGQ